MPVLAAVPDEALVVLVVAVVAEGTPRSRGVCVAGAYGASSGAEVCSCVRECDTLAGSCGCSSVRECDALAGSCACVRKCDPLRVWWK